MIITKQFVYLLSDIEVTTQTNLPYLEDFEEFFNHDEEYLNLFWYLWFLRQKNKRYKKAVKKLNYTGSFKQFLYRQKK